MKFTKKEIFWVKRNEPMILQILEKRIDDLKEQILDVPDEKRDALINFIKEYKLGIGIIKELGSDKKVEEWTGI